MLIAAIVGAVMAIRQQANTAEIRTEHERLATKVGRISAKNEQSYYVVRYGDINNTAFRFRMVTPAGLKLIRKHTSISFSGKNFETEKTTREPRQVSVLIRKTKNRIQVALVDSSDGSSVFSIADKEEAKLISDNWDQLEFECAGAESQDEFDKHESVKLLEIRLPPELIEQLGERGERYKKNSLFRYEIGTANSKTKAANKKKSN